MPCMHACFTELTRPALWYRGDGKITAKSNNIAYQICTGVDRSKHAPQKHENHENKDAGGHADFITLLFAFLW